MCNHCACGDLTNDECCQYCEEVQTVDPLRRVIDGTRVVYLDKLDRYPILLKVETTGTVEDIELYLTPEQARELAHDLNIQAFFARYGTNF